MRESFAVFLHASVSVDIHSTQQKHRNIMQTRNEYMVGRRVECYSVVKHLWSERHTHLWKVALPRATTGRLA